MESCLHPTPTPTPVCLQGAHRNGFNLERCDLLEPEAASLGLPVEYRAVGTAELAGTALLCLESYSFLTPTCSTKTGGVTCWNHSDGKRTEGMMRMGEWRYNSKHPQHRQRLEESGNLHASAAVDLVKMLRIASEWESEGAPEPIWRSWPGIAGNRKPVGSASRHYIDWAINLTSSYFPLCGFTHLMIQRSNTELHILTRMWDLAHSYWELKIVLGWEILHSPSVVSVRVKWGDCGCTFSHCCSS